MALGFPRPAVDLADAVVELMADVETEAEIQILKMRRFSSGK